MKNIKANKEITLIPNTENQKGIQNHKLIASHYQAAAKHHLQAAKHNKGGNFKSSSKYYCSIWPCQLS
jgi:hypothetical protein